MRLINTENFKLESFTSSNIPPYMALSHTWSDDVNEEVSFQEMNDLDKAKIKCGFSKIEMTCKLARTKEIAYAWVDTCCINKSASAELSESLNSMYSWYQKSHICYVYINDWQCDSDWVDLTPLEQSEGSIDQDDDSGKQEDDFDEGDGGSSEEGYSEVEDGGNAFTMTPWQKEERSPARDNSIGVPSNDAADRETCLQSGSSSIDQPPQKAPLR